MSTWGYLLSLPVGSGLLELRGNGEKSISFNGTEYFSVIYGIMGNTKIRNISGRCCVNGQHFSSVTELKHGYSISIQQLQKEYVFVNCSASDKVLRMMDLDENYAIGQMLGEGGFGQVYLCFEKKSTSAFALKISTSNTLSSAREADILYSLNNPHTITTHAIKTMNGINKTFIMMEYMAGGDLSRFVNHREVNLTPWQTKLIFYQVVQAVSYLHAIGICHRDLKPANILLSRPSPDALVKVTDLGIAKSEIWHSPMDTSIGTRGFMAPEILNQQYTKVVDVWSLGVILYMSFTASFPDMNGNIQTIPSAHANVMNLLKKMLQVSPSNRATIEEVRKNEWLQDCNVKRKVEEILKREKSQESRKKINFNKTSPVKHFSNKFELLEAALRGDNVTRNASIVTVIGVIVVAAWFIFFH